MIVAANIETAMKRRNMDAAKLARAAGLNPTGIYDILSGKSRSPRLDTIGKIAKALNVRISDLFDDMSADEVRSQIDSVFSELDPEEQRKLVLTAQAWLSAREPQ